MSRYSPDFVVRTGGVRMFLTMITLLNGISVCPVTGTQSHESGIGPEAFQQGPSHGYGSNLHGLNRNNADYYGQPQRSYRQYKNYGYRRPADDVVNPRSAVRYVRQPPFVLHHAARYRPTEQPPLLPPENQLSNMLQAEPAVCSTSRCDLLPCCDRRQIMNIHKAKQLVHEYSELISLLRWSLFFSFGYKAVCSATDIPHWKVTSCPGKSSKHPGNIWQKLGKDQRKPTSNQMLIRILDY